MKYEELIKSGNLEEALSELENSVRANPADAGLRVVLFQLLSVMGNWERAMTQLNVAAEMDANNLLMAQPFHEFFRFNNSKSLIEFFIEFFILDGNGVFFQNFSVIIRRG